MKLRKTIGLFVGSVAMVFYGAQGLHADTIQVTVTPSAQPIQIPPFFLGLSYEKDSMDTHLWRPDNAAAIALYKRLGPAVLRVAGDSVDYDTWNPAGTGKKWNEIAPLNINQLAGFLQATNWKVIYAVNMGSGTPATSAAEAAYATQALGDSIFGMEIGNEPDKYNTAEEHYRPPSYTAADYNAEWSVFASALLAKSPHAPLVGPDAGYAAGYIPAFAAAQKNVATLLTYHHYGYHQPSVTDTNSLIQILLAPNTELSNIYVQGNASATTNHIPRGWRIDETNTYTVPADGISNGQVSALWAIDYMFDTVRNGNTGVCFTGGFDDILPNYTPIADDGARGGNVTAVMPLYYAMYLFSMVDRGTLMETSVSASATTLSANALTMPDGSVSVVLNNKDATQSDQVTIQMPGAAAQYYSLLLTAPSLTSKNATTFGGAKINIDGSWNPTSNPVVPVIDNKITVTVPPASALLIQSQSEASPIIINPNSPLGNPKVFPNPWRADGHYASQMTFTQIPAGTDIRIFTVSGHLVNSLTAGSSGTAIWNLQNKSGSTVASGLYLYTLSDNQGDTARGKFAIIR